MNYIMILRPQTLFASAVPVLVAMLCVARGGYAIDSLVAVVTLVCGVSLQILSNLINDYYDFKRGADKKGRAGFSRALAEGTMTERQMLAACVICATCCVLMGLYLVYVGGLPILVIGASALLFAWLYTATSHSLSYLGIADIFVFLYYGVIAAVGTAYLLTDSYLPQTLHSGAVSGLISMLVLMINNLRDRDSDREAGKKTLPVRFGKFAAESLMLLWIVMMPVFAWLAYGLSWAMLIIIPALLLWIKVKKAVGAEYNKCLIMAGLLNVCYLILVLLS